jgi:hypothetical protein
MAYHLSIDIADPADIQEDDLRLRGDNPLQQDIGDLSRSLRIHHADQG